ncbi:putative uncharacterized protein ENSP00000383309 [Mustela putorius furo]|uniref:Uncharacterized protein n=1 Tax=Mustela putorius furo TaxID=9669 RepID=A0A8U0V5X3_MUSPF|nr:putative uncharacterized protein ENSP00000383309 [Mustela putorius furo]
MEGCRQRGCGPRNASACGVPAGNTCQTELGEDVGGGAMLVKEDGDGEQEEAGEGLRSDRVSRPHTSTLGHRRDRRRKAAASGAPGTPSGPQASSRVTPEGSERPSATATAPATDSQEKACLPFTGRRGLGLKVAPSGGWGPGRPARGNCYFQLFPRSRTLAFHKTDDVAVLKDGPQPLADGLKLGWERPVYCCSRGAHPVDAESPNPERISASGVTGRTRRHKIPDYFKGGSAPPAPPAASAVAEAGGAGAARRLVAEPAPCGRTTPSFPALNKALRIPQVRSLGTGGSAARRPESPRCWQLRLRSGASEGDRLSFNLPQAVRGSQFLRVQGFLVASWLALGGGESRLPDTARPQPLARIPAAGVCGPRPAAGLCGPRPAAGVCRPRPAAGVCRAPPSGRCLRAPPSGRCLRAPPSGRCLRAPPSGRCLRAPPSGRCLPGPAQRQVSAGPAQRQVSAGPAQRQVSADPAQRRSAPPSGRCLRAPPSGRCLRAPPSGRCLPHPTPHPPTACLQALPHSTSVFKSSYDRGALLGVIFLS